MSVLQEEIMKQIQQKKQLEKLRKSQQLMSSQPNNTLVDKVSNLGSNLNNFGSKLSQSNLQPIANLGVKTQNVGNAIGNFANTSQGLNTLSGGISKVAPAANAATGALEVGGNLLNGNYTDAGLNTAKTAATLAGGPIGLGIASAIQAFQFLNGEKDKANAKALQKVNEETQKSQQANEESLAGLQDRFQQDSEQAAQNMTLPTDNQTLVQNIMSKINPNYVSSGVGSPTGYAAGINYPEAIQTPQNEPSPSPQIEDINGNVSDFPTTREKFAESLLNNGWEQGIVDSALQGLNGGNKDIADYINAYNNNASDDQKIAIPQTDEEIELARNGQFYNPQPVSNNNVALKESLIEKVKNGLGDFKAGYDDNSLHGFADGDLANKLAVNAQQVSPQNGVLTGGAAQTKKTVMNRLGEAVGTGRRLMANPWVQAGIAGVISKADGGDIGDIAQAAYKYGTSKAMSDQYYKAIHPDAKVTPVFNTYGAEDYKAKAYNDYNQMRTNINAPTADEYYKQQFLQGYISADKYNEIVNDPNYNPTARVNLNQVKQSQNNANNVRKTDIQADKNNWQKQQGQQKIGIQQQNANTNAGRLTETKRSNSVKEKQNQQKIDNTKANNDMNYNLKVQQHQQKLQQELVNGDKVRIKAPNGEIKYIPKDKVDAAIAAGGVRL